MGCVGDPPEVGHVRDSWATRDGSWGRSPSLSPDWDPSLAEPLGPWGLLRE